MAQYRQTDCCTAIVSRLTRLSYEMRHGITQDPISGGQLPVGSVEFSLSIKHEEISQVLVPIFLDYEREPNATITHAKLNRKFNIVATRRPSTFFPFPGISRKSSCTESMPIQNAVISEEDYVKSFLGNMPGEDHLRFDCSKFLRQYLFKSGNGCGRLLTAFLANHFPYHLYNIRQRNLGARVRGCGGNLLFFGSNFFFTLTFGSKKSTLLN